MSRRAALAVGAVLAVASMLSAGTDDLPNVTPGRGVCFEDVGCEDGTPWDCRVMGNGVCGTSGDESQGLPRSGQ